MFIQKWRERTSEMNNYDVWIQKIKTSVYPEIPYHSSDFYPEFTDFIINFFKRTDLDFLKVCRKIVVKAVYDMG